MAGAVDLTASMGGGGGSLDPLIAALDRYSQMLERVASAMGAAVPESQEPLTRLTNTGPKSYQSSEGELPAIEAIRDLGRIVADWGDATVKSLTTMNAQVVASLGAMGDKSKNPSPVDSKKLNNEEEKKGKKESKAPTNLGEFVNSLASAVKGINVWAYALEKSMAQIGRLVDMALAPIGDFIEIIGQALTPVAETIAAFIKMSGVMQILLPVIKILGKLLQVVSLPFKFLAGVVGAFGDALDLAIQQFEIVIDALSFIFDAATAATGALGLFGKSAKTAQESVKQGFESVKKSIGKVLLDPFNAVPSLISQIRGAVETLNPAAMIEFDMTMRDLTAVFGTAFMPIVKTATQVLRELAEKLYPIFQKLAPVFENMTKAIGDTLIGNIERLADAFERLQPAIMAYMEKQIYAAERTSLLAEQYYNSASALEAAGSWFANWFRTNKALEESNKARRKPRDESRREPGKTVGLAAATSPGFKSIADLSRETLQQAFVATSMPSTREQQNARAQQNVAQLPEVIRQAAQEAFVAAMQQMEQIKPVAPQDAVFAPGVA